VEGSAPSKEEEEMASSVAVRNSGHGRERGREKLEKVGMIVITSGSTGTSVVSRSG
jgi:hypothetical protein